MKAITLLIATASILAVSSSNAAQYALINLQGGAGLDTLWSNADSTPMTSGFVTIGYFATNPLITEINTPEGLASLLGTFTAMQTAVPGTSTAFPGPGYLAEDFAQGVQVSTISPLFGRNIYAIASDASGLASATGNNAYSVFFVSTHLEDSPIEQQYIANPANVITPIMGSIGSWEGDPGGIGQGTFRTLNLVPEPSAALLGALGALGLLRRRRN